MAMNTVWLVNLATVPYGDALDLQHRLVDARKRGALNDTLLLLEHPPFRELNPRQNLLRPTKSPLLSTL